MHDSTTELRILINRIYPQNGFSVLKPYQDMSALCLYDIPKLFGMNSKEICCSTGSTFIANDFVFSDIENIKSRAMKGSGNVNNICF